MAARAGGKEHAARWYQGDTLLAMTQWKIPILKATVQIKPSAIIIRLSYEVQGVALPPMGGRNATLGPLRDGRLLLRTELQTRDYSSKVAEILSKKDSWDLIRRRAMTQIGWRKGHARAKRKLLATMSWDDWLQSHLHMWSRDLINWCGTQGVGTIRIESIANGDWPADRFIALLTYKGADAGIRIAEGADVMEAGGERAAKSVVQRQAKKVQRRRQAEREIQHQLEMRGEKGA